MAVRLSKLRYNKAHFDEKGSIHRALRSFNSWRRAKAAGAEAVLHVTMLDMPVVIGSGLRHYVLIDNTWDIWRREFRSAGYTSKLLSDIESLDGRSLRQAEHVFTLGRHVRENLIDHYRIPASKCTAIGSGRGGIEPYRGPKDYRNRTVLFVAKTRFDSKGGHLLVAAAKILASLDPSIKFLIVGSEESSKFASGSSNIECRTFVPLSELQQLFNEAALFVLPALNEPWGLVYLEAMSCKTPVVGLRRNSLPELTGDGRWGFMIDDPDPAKLADAIFDALADPEALAVKGREAQERMLEYYTWDAAMDRMLAVIDQAQ